MKKRFLLWLTQQPVYDYLNPASGTLKLTAWILNEKLLIVETLVAPKDTDLKAFTKNAISWANSRVTSVEGEILAVGGDAANEAAIAASGSKHTKVSTFRDVDW